jgi:hypothetical protein
LNPDKIIPARTISRPFRENSNLSRTTRKRRCFVSLCRKIEGSDVAARSRATVRVTSRGNTVAAKEARQLASCADETSITASRRGHGTKQSPDRQMHRSNRAAAKTPAPEQLTLDTPRASAGAAEADLSEKRRALPACVVNDSRASAAPGSVACSFTAY